MLSVETDYRLVYHHPQIFCEKVQRRILEFTGAKHDIPEFHQLFDDMWDVMLQIFLETHPLPEKPEATQQIQYILETGDPELAGPFLYEYAGRHFLELFRRDLLLYLRDEQIGFLFRGPLPSRTHEAYIQNAPIQSVW